MAASQAMYVCIFLGGGRRENRSKRRIKCDKEHRCVYNAGIRTRTNAYRNIRYSVAVQMEGHESGLYMHMYMYVM